LVSSQGQVASQTADVTVEHLERHVAVTEQGARNIVVGFDESDGAADALRWAVAEAELHVADLTAVMAWSPLDQHHIVGDQSDPAYGAGDAFDALRSYITSAVGSDRAGTVNAEVVCDLPARALLDASRRADLLVVGTRGLGGFRGLLLGSVSQHCLHHTTVPIAIVRSHSNPQAKRIVVGVDGSKNAQRALQWAIAEARRRKAQLDVVTAWQIPYTGNPPLLINTPPWAVSERAAANVLHREIADAHPDADSAPRLLALPGNPASVLLEQSSDADLLVVGSRGLGAFKLAFLGSVASQLSHHAACSIVVIPDATQS
jgi:nucleotide-binding universal stress UspA family protein